MTSTVKAPRITLVGAGPGDPELISVKGLKAIQSADVILYDALINEALLLEAPQAKALFVGKRKGEKSLSQKEINTLIVDQALKYGHVVRLKGGDSFVFGRGFEEIQFIRRFGIPVDVVPGISSSISAPALAGIPVSHRGISTSFSVLTATLSDGSLNPEIEEHAKLNGTLVILMGLNKLDEISAVYRKYGKEQIPFAIISNASLKEQKSFTGTASDIKMKSAGINMKSPATIVIGEVVSLSETDKTNPAIINYN